jgi:hypothetical protein
LYSLYVIIKHKYNEKFAKNFISKIGPLGAEFLHCRLRAKKEKFSTKNDQGRGTLNIGPLRADFTMCRA